MTKFLTISDKKGNSFETEIEWDKTDGSVILHFGDDRFRDMKASGDDLFSSLQQLRKILEEKEHFILCLGSAINVYPSRMSRQMSNGTKAYKLELGRQAGLTDIVDIFDPATENEVGTLSEQRNFFDKWIQSINR